MSQIIGFFQQGGMFMIPIALCLLFSVVISIERFFKVYYLYSIDSTSFISKVQNLTLQKNYDQAISLCNSKETALLPRVIKSALQGANETEHKVNIRIEEATLGVLPLIEKRQSILPMIANVATLLGLLGTIVGLIEAFGAVASAEPALKAELLTQSISIAMNTTAFGLIVAIPTNIFHTIIQERATKIIGDIDQYAVRISHLLSLSSAKG